MVYILHIKQTNFIYLLVQEAVKNKDEESLKRIKDCEQIFESQFIKEKVQDCKGPCEAQYWHDYNRSSSGRLHFS
jgi:hypothetical protein